MKKAFFIIAALILMAAPCNAEGIGGPAKTAAEARIAQMGILNFAIDMTSSVSRSIMDSSGKHRDEIVITPFAMASGNSAKYWTGSNVDLRGVNVMVGAAGTWRAQCFQAMLASFFEYGGANYETHDNGRFGRGHAIYRGGGAMLRAEIINCALEGLYAEGSFHAGVSFLDWDGSGMGGYDIFSPYEGFHAEVGYMGKVTNQFSIGPYVRYAYSHFWGDSARFGGERHHFDDVYSQRLRAGIRARYEVNEQLAFSLGAAYEREFNGVARSTVNGMGVRAPNCKGDIVIIEASAEWKPIEDLTLAANVEGYLGKREGFGGSLQAQWDF